MHKLLLSAAILVPFAAFALDYTPATERYDDAARFTQAESAGISLLTRLGVVEGNPDGTFAPRRPVNRAEFTKIALLAHGLEVISADADNCFPDVRTNDWFSRYVCLAKRRGTVQGNPDGMFHPERTVNYAEALKIMGELTGVESADPDGREWYARYREGAIEAGVALQPHPPMDRELSRGDVARLVAAYVAYMDNELDLYRDAERGVFHSSSSISSSSVSSSSSSSSVSSSSSFSSTSSSSSTSSTAFGFPARSHFLVAGERSQPIASATFFANLEPLFVRGAEVRLENDIDGIESMFIVDSAGTPIGQIYLDKVYDSTEKTWRGTFPSAGAYRLPKSEQRVLGVEIRMKGRNLGGTSEEMVQVDSFSLTTEGEWTQNNATNTQNVLPYPKHQTAMARVTAVANAIAESEALPLGPNNILAAFRITTSAVEGVTPKIEHLEFQVSKSSNVLITNWSLGIPDSTERWPCSVNDTIVSCSSIPSSIGTMGAGQNSKIFRLFGDVTLAPGGTDRTLQISLNQPGGVDQIGAIRWTDGTGHFNWVELDSPLARSTRFN